MVNFKEDEALNTLNHSCAHLMAQAIRHLYPQAKFWVGPVVAEGFYYDVDFGDHVFKEEDLAAIEKEMKKIAKRGFKIIRKEISKEEALEMFKDDEYKLDLAIVMALISSYKDRPLDEKTIVFGEVGLSGEVRAVSMAEQRVHEAVKMGFTRCILPMVNVSKLKPRSDIRLEGVANVREAIGLL